MKRYDDLKLINIRSYLKKNIQELKENIERLRKLLEITDKILVAESFLNADKIQALTFEQIVKQKIADKNMISLKTRSGVLLANMYVAGSEVRIIIVSDFTLDINTPPFQAFIVDRILETMRKEDLEAARRGKMTANDIFSYEFVRDGDTIKEIIIKNYNDDSHLREIQSSIRWTLEKMWEIHQ